MKTYTEIKILNEASAEFNIKKKQKLIDELKVHVGEMDQRMGKYDTKTQLEMLSKAEELIGKIRVLVNKTNTL